MIQMVNKLIISCKTYNQIVSLFKYLPIEADNHILQIW